MDLFCSPCSVNPCLSERTSEAPAVSWEAREGLKKVLMEVLLAFARENVREGMVLDVGEGINCSDSVQEWAAKGEKAKSNRYYSQPVPLSVRAAQSSCTKGLLLWWGHWTQPRRSGTEAALPAADTWL